MQELVLQKKVLINRVYGFSNSLKLWEADTYYILAGVVKTSCDISKTCCLAIVHRETDGYELWENGWWCSLQIEYGLGTSQVNPGDADVYICLTTLLN